MLLAQLPLESATQTARLAQLDDADFTELAEREHTHGPWSHTDLLLAGVADAIERLIYVQTVRAGVKSATPPDPIPRPGVRATRTKPGLSAAGRHYLERLRDTHRQRQEGA